MIVLVLVVLAGAGAYFFLKPQPAQIQLPVANNPLKQEIFLNLETPSENTLAAENQIEVKGKTLPNSTVAYYTDNDAGTVVSDQSGNFAGNLVLEEGINTLTVTAFSDEGTEKSITLDLVNDPQGT